MRKRETPTWIERGFGADGSLLWETPVEEGLSETRLFNWITMNDYRIVRTNRNLVELARVDQKRNCQRLTWTRVEPYLFEQDITERTWPTWEQ